MRLKRPSALLFDLDGTLVDSRRDIAAACNAALRAHGREPLPLERIMPMVGDGARALVARAFAKSEDDPEVTEALATFQASYAERPAEQTVLLPGAEEVLAVGIRCALVTNKPRSITELLLRDLGLRDRFTGIWGGGDGPLKPSPAGVLQMLAQLGVRPTDAWFVGDGPQDVGAGRAAGCFTVAVPGIAERDRLLASEPDLVVESLHDLVRAIPS